MAVSGVLKLSPARIAFGYAAISVLWIALSDIAVAYFGLPPSLSILKGSAFVVVTAYLLYATTKRLVSSVRQASAERDETANLYRTVVETSGEGICLLDAAGIIVFLNQRLATMLGGAVEEFRGKPLEDFIERTESLEGHHARSGTRECRLRVPGDRNCWVLISSTPLLRADSTPAGSLAVLLDITERKRLEDELRHSQKLEALGSFAGGITHDFSNLLSIVTGYGSVLEKASAPDSEEQKAAREILNASERGARLIRQLLAFSRKQAMVTETIDVREYVGRFGEVLPRIVGENIRVTLECHENTGHARIGAGQLDQILMNLSANARDAMPRGGALTVSTARADVTPVVALAQGVKAGSYVVIRVTDTGTGIDPEIKSRIFEPFFTTKAAGSGTGLGLATVYGIAAQNGGFINCNSTVGLGTTFSVYLPVVEKSTEVNDSGVDIPAVVVGSETLLLVEDEPVLRALTKQILSSHGYEVWEAGNGLEALGVIERAARNPDLLLTDIVMPGMSGVDLAEKVARISPETAIVFMSGYSELPIEPEHAAYIIQKPVTPDSLLVQLRTVLNERHGRNRVA